MQRCTGPETQKSVCVAHHALSEAPKSLLFVGEELWLSLLTGKESIQVYEHSTWRQRAELATEGWGRLRKNNDQIYFLRTKDSVLMRLDPNEKKIVEQIDVPGAWASDFEFTKDGVVVSSWHSNQLTELKETTHKTMAVHAPRGILAFDDSIWVNSYEEARLTQLKGEDATVLFKSEGAFQELFWDERTRSFFIADVKKGIVWQHLLDENDTSAAVTLSKVKLKHIFPPAPGTLPFRFSLASVAVAFL